MAKFISDEEMKKLEAENVTKPASTKKIITDEEMSAMEAQEQSFLDKESPLGPSLRETGETIHDGILGATQGMLFNAADELGAGIATVADKGIETVSSMIPGTDAYKLKEAGVPSESMANNYKMYQEASQNEFKEAEERSPWAYGAGQIGGGIGTGIAAGAKLGANVASKSQPILDIAKTDKLKAGIELLKRGGTNYTKASPLMALEGITGSEGNLIGGTNEEQTQVGKDVVSNLAFGLPTVLGMQAVSDVVAPSAKKGAQKVADKVGEIVEDSDFLQQLKIMKEYGEEGINPVSRKNAVSISPGKEGLIRREGTRAQGIMDEILKADETLGKEVGESLTKADAAGIRFNINPIIDDSFGKVASDMDRLMGLSENSQSRKIFNRIVTKGSSELSPSEAKLLLDDVDATIKRLTSYKAPPPEIEDSVQLLSNFRSKLDKEMRNQIKPYDLAKTRFHEFRQLVPETIISGETPVDISKVWMGDLKNPEKDMFNRIKGLTKYSTASGSANAPVKEAFENTIQGMNEWQAKEAARGTKNPLSTSAEDMAKRIRDYANDAAARRSATTTAEARAFGTNLATAASGFGQSTRSMALGGANIAGRVSSSKAVKSAGQKARYVYNLPSEKLNEAADKMLNTKGLQTLGQALKDGLANGDQSKKNAALFSIMQNPNASLFFNDEEQED